MVISLVTNEIYKKNKKLLKQRANHKPHVRTWPHIMVCNHYIHGNKLGEMHIWIFPGKRTIFHDHSLKFKNKWIYSFFFSIVTRVLTSDHQKIYRWIAFKKRLKPTQTRKNDRNGTNLFGLLNTQRILFSFFCCYCACTNASCGRYRMNLNEYFRITVAVQCGVVVYLSMVSFKWCFFFLCSLGLEWVKDECYFIVITFVWLEY